MKNFPILSLCLTLAVAAAALPLFAQSAPPASPTPDIGGPDALWRNPAKSPDERAKDLLPRLTLEEKISLLHADGTFTSPGLPRFGIRKLWMSDGPNGVREEIQPSGWNSANHTDDFATAMPASVGLAASFDPELAKAFGNVIGQEARVRNKNIMLCPGLNIMRTPLNGRNSEYFGEDPFLAARMAVGFINGVQQNDVAACAKHYALNNQENNRGSVNAKVDERTMREIYLPAFKAAVTEAHALTVMTAYNRVNGQYCAENDFLLNTVLKKEWGFQGLVMTDWGGCHSTVASARNGLDLEMGSNVQGNHANDFLAAGKLIPVIGDGEGKVPMSRIDDAALRNLRVMAATGLFDAPKELTSAQKEQFALLSPAHLQTARSVVESSCVLLKNANSLLPLDAGKVKSIAVIGDVAQAAFAHDGNSAAIKTRNEVNVLQGIKNRAGTGVNVTFAQGYARATGRGGPGRRGLGGAVTPDAATASAPASPLTADAVAAAKNADVAVVVAGLYRAQDQEGADRPNFNLPAGQAELIQAVCAANPKTIVILTGGSPSNVAPWLDQCGALMMYWYGGTEGGNGLARLLFGDANPSGHLPCSWPKQLADSPAHNPNDPAIFPGTGGGMGGRGAGPDETYAEGLLVGYRWFDEKKIDPQFPFGYGLSYTTFEFSSIKVSPASGPVGTEPPIKNAIARVDVMVDNTGLRTGATIAQLYIEPVNPKVMRPVRELKGFRKVTVKPNQGVGCQWYLDASAFAYYDVDKHAWVAEPGDYTLYVGDSSRNLPLKTTFKLEQLITIKEGQ
jgi:beta-glucosidase